MKLIAIPPERFDAARHRLPIAGELLLPGVQALVSVEGVAVALREALMGGGAYGTVIELAKPGEAVEVALDAERQEDGGYFFTGLWVLEG